MQDSIETALENIKNKFTKLVFSESEMGPKLFLCYAWVAPEDLKENPEWNEHDVSGRLERMHNYLRKAGFQPHFDKKSNNIEKTVSHMMERIKDADYVICCLTPVFKAKYSDVNKKLSTEFGLIQERLKQRETQKVNSGVHVYTLADYEGSVPHEWHKSEGDLLIRTLPKDDLDALKLILKNLLLHKFYSGFDPVNEKQFDDIWANVDTRLDDTSPSTYSAVTQRLTAEQSSSVEKNHRQNRTIAFAIGNQGTGHLEANFDMTNASETTAASDFVNNAKVNANSGDTIAYVIGNKTVDNNAKATANFKF